MKNFKLTSKLTRIINTINTNTMRAVEAGVAHYQSKGYTFAGTRPNADKGWLYVLIALCCAESAGAFAKSWESIILSNPEYNAICTKRAATYSASGAKTTDKYLFTYFGRLSTPAGYAENYLNSLRGWMLDAGLIHPYYVGNKAYYYCTKLGREAAGAYVCAISDAHAATR